MPLRHVSDCELVGSQKSGLSYAIGVYNALRPVLRFGVAPGRSLCDASLLNVNLTKVDSERDRVLANDELRVLLPLLHAKRGQSYDDYVLFLLLISLRREEAANLT